MSSNSSDTERPSKRSRHTGAIIIPTTLTLFDIPADVLRIIFSIVLNPHSSNPFPFPEWYLLICRRIDNFLRHPDSFSLWRTVLIPPPVFQRGSQVQYILQRMFHLHSIAPASTEGAILQTHCLPAPVEMIESGNNTYNLIIPYATHPTLSIMTPFVFSPPEWNNWCYLHLMSEVWIWGDSDWLTFRAKCRRSSFPLLKTLHVIGTTTMMVLPKHTQLPQLEFLEVYSCSNNLFSPTSIVKSCLRTLQRIKIHCQTGTGWQLILESAPALQFAFCSFSTLPDLVLNHANLRELFIRTNNVDPTGAISLNVPLLEHFTLVPQPYHPNSFPLGLDWSIPWLSNSGHAPLRSQSFGVQVFYGLPKLRTLYLGIPESLYTILATAIQNDFLACPLLFSFKCVVETRYFRGGTLLGSGFELFGFMDGAWDQRGNKKPDNDE